MFTQLKRGIATRWDAFLMALRFRLRPEAYIIRRTWHQVGTALPIEQAQEEILRFFRHAVKLSPRPYGKGTYTAVLYAHLRGEPRPCFDSDFSYPERSRVEAELGAFLDRALPDADGIDLTLEILPYGAVYLGLPVRQNF